MKVKLLSFILALTMAAGLFAVSAEAAEDFVLKAEFEFSEAGEFLVVSGTTPAKYGQAINIVAYDPAFTNGLEDIRLQNGELSGNPAEMKPLTEIGTQLIRWAEVRADAKGEYSIRFALGDITNGQYLMVKASGSGATPVSASCLRQYYTSDTITQVTLPAFEAATANDLETLLRQNQLLLSIELGDDYNQNKDKIHAMFISVRNNDYTVSAATGKKFNSMDDVKNVLDIVTALRNFPANATGDDVKDFISKYASLIDYDFSTGNKDYNLVKDAACSIAANILNDKAPECMTDIKTAIAQAVALAMLNTKDADTVGPVVTRYAEVLGLDETDYEIYCSLYTAYQVNKAFVDRGFTKPSEVLTALAARVNVLKEDGGSQEETIPPSGYNGNNSSTAGLKNVIGVGSVVSDKEKDEAQGTYYSDITDRHWAYEYIRKLSLKKIIEGYPDGTIKPEDPVTREQFLKMLISAFGLDGDTEVNFSDVEDDRWSVFYIKSAIALGIADGMGDGTFAPGALVTRQDAAVMIARLCAVKGIVLSGRSGLTDSEEIASYALESVERLVYAGIISGFEDGSFRPAEKLTRGQGAKLICELSER